MFPGFGLFLLKAGILFIVIVGGVVVGFLIAGHLNRRGVAGEFELGSAGLLNRTALKVGDVFPEVNVGDGQNDTIPLMPELGGRKAILCFVSRGCEPCVDLVSFLKENGLPAPSRSRVVLLAAGIQGYESGDFDCFLVDRPTIDELGIRMFPTVIGVDPEGRVAFVSSGFSRALTAPIIEEHL
jgi:hypothetical protein